MIEQLALQKVLEIPLQKESNTRWPELFDQIVHLEMCISEMCLGGK